MTEISRTDVGIIGAGPYGLALAAHLRERNISYRIFGRPMNSWLRYMPAGMYLKSEGIASSIADPERRFTLSYYCRLSDRPYRDRGLPVSIETFAEYGLWFQRTLVPELEQTDVGAVRRSGDGDGFDVALVTGEVAHARRVVVASGHVPYRYTPPELCDLPPERLSHSADHRDFKAFAGKDVAVIGGGQSALETAALLHEQGARPHVLVRKQSISWNDGHSSDPSKHSRSLREVIPKPASQLGAGWKLWFYSELPTVFYTFPEATRLRLVKETLGPSGAWWLRDRVEGKIAVLLGHAVIGSSVDNGETRLRLRAVGGEQTDLCIDSVVAATGYKVDLARLAFLDSDLQREVRQRMGAPVLSPYFESSVPGLYFVGLTAANTFGPVMRFVCGSGFAARRVTRHLEKGRNRRDGLGRRRLES